FTFEQGRSSRFATVFVSRRDGLTIHAGIENLVLLKTTKSAFLGYLKDSYNTIKETADRILATSVTAKWRYSNPAIEFNAVMGSCRRILVEVFAGHNSLAVQQTLY